MSSYRTPLWDLQPDITSCRNVAVWNLRSVSVGRPLWRKDGSAICSVITQWSESHRTRNHSLLSHLRLPKPGGPGPRIYIPHEQGGPVIPPGTGFPLDQIWPLLHNSEAGKTEDIVYSVRIHGNACILATGLYVTVFFEFPCWALSLETGHISCCNQI
jgi:hypothetical protein